MWARQRPNRVEVSRGSLGVPFREVRHSGGGIDTETRDRDSGLGALGFGGPAEPDRPDTYRRLAAELDFSDQRPHAAY